MKCKNQLGHGKNEAFCYVIPSRINLLFLKSGNVCNYRAFIGVALLAKIIIMFCKWRKLTHNFSNENPKKLLMIWSYRNLLKKRSQWQVHTESLVSLNFSCPEQVCTVVLGTYLNCKRQVRSVSLHSGFLAVIEACSKCIRFL